MLAVKTVQLRLDKLNLGLAKPLDFKKKKKKENKKTKINGGKTIMTRQEFIDNVTEWHELIDFCNDHGLSICDDIMCSDAFDECVEEDVSNRDCGWYELMDALNDLPS